MHEETQEKLDGETKTQAYRTQAVCQVISCYRSGLVKSLGGKVLGMHLRNFPGRGDDYLAWIEILLPFGRSTSCEG